MNDLVKSVRATGGIGVVGVFIPEDQAVGCPRSSARMFQRFFVR